jgi:hypothetical protein
MIWILAPFAIVCGAIALRSVFHLIGSAFHGE